MEDVRDVEGKLICKIDPNTKMVEILQRGIKTTVQFLQDGTFEYNSVHIKQTA